MGKDANVGKDAYMTPQEAAQLLNITRNTVYRLIKNGKLHAVKVGKVWRIPPALSPLKFITRAP